MAEKKISSEPSPEPEAIRGEVRLAGHRRVSHGLFLPHVADLSREREFLRELKAWQLVLPDDSGFTHVTGAELLGWRLPHLPDRPHLPVFTAITGDGSRPRRAGLICSRLVRPANTAVINGVRVEQPEEIVLRTARDLGLLDLTILIDSGRHLGHLDPARIRAILAARYAISSGSRRVVERRRRTLVSSRCVPFTDECDRALSRRVARASC